MNFPGITVRVHTRTGGADAPAPPRPGPLSMLNTGLWRGGDEMVLLESLRVGLLGR